mgnify:CR=1 FL=1
MDYELLKNGNIKVGEKFNELIINSSKGIINTENIDKNIILFSYKEDFFYISELEILELKKNETIFKELEAEIILMTAGNLLSHYAWINNIKNKAGVEIDFPIVEDKIGENCRKYGMYSKENNNEIISKTVIIFLFIAILLVLNTAYLKFNFIIRLTLSIKIRAAHYLKISFN